MRINKRRIRTIKGGSEMKYYKFKNVKHSVTMVFVTKHKDGSWILENAYYKDMFYKAKPEELEEVKDESTK